MFLLGVVSVIGGINADIPGVTTDPAMRGLIGFFSRALTSTLYILVHYWDGVLIAITVLTIVIGFVSDDRIDQRKAEFDHRRQKKLGPCLLYTSPSPRD